MGRDDDNKDEVTARTGESEEARESAMRVSRVRERVMLAVYPELRGLGAREREAATRAIARTLMSLVGGGRKRRGLVVGIAPGRGRDEPWAEGGSADRLTALLGAGSVGAMRESVDLANVHSSFAYDKKASREKGRLLRRELRGRPFVVVVGKEAAEALGLGEWGYWEPDTVGRTSVVVIPHTSGRCRYWNDEAGRAVAEAFFNGLLLGRRELRHDSEEQAGRGEP